MDIAFVNLMQYTPAFWHTHEFFELLCAINGRCRNIFEDTEIVMVNAQISQLIIYMLQKNELPH